VLYNRLNFSVFLLLALVFALFFRFFTFGDSDIGFVSDDAIYLLTAEYYSPWVVTTYPVFEHAHNVTRFPPFYPMVLGLMGANTNSPDFAMTLNFAMLVGFVLLFAIWVYKETRQPFAAIALSVSICVMPSTLLMSQDLWSEFLFGSLVFLVLLILPRDNTPSTRWLLAALLVALVPLTRTIGLSLVVAFCLVIVCKRPRNALSLIGSSVLPITLWLSYRSKVMTDESYVGTILDELTANSEAGFWSVGEIIYSRVISLWDGWEWVFLTGDVHPFPAIVINLIVGLLLLLSMVGLIARLLSLQIDSIYVIVYLLVVMIWPYSDVYFTSRFLFAIFPITLFYAWVALDRVVRYRKMVSAPIVIIVTSVLVVVLPSSVPVMRVAMASVEPELRPYSRSRQWLKAKSTGDAIEDARYKLSLTNALKDASELIPVGACVFSVQTPVVMFHTKRVAYGVPKPNISDKEFDTRSKTCRYFVLMGVRTGGEKYPVFYPLDRLRNRKNYQFAFFEDENKKPMVIIAERVIENDQ